MAAFTFAIQMTLIMFGGAILRRTGRVGDDAAKPLTRLFIDLVIPCSIVNSMASSPFSVETLGNSLLLVGLGFLYYLVVGAAAFLITGLAEKDSELINPHRFAMITPNFTAMGTPVSEAFYGAPGVLYNTMMGLPMRLVVYITLPLMFMRKHAGDARPPFSEVLRGGFRALNIPPVWATAVGLILFITQWKLPTLLLSTLAMVSKMSLPLGVLLCGVIIGGIPKGVKPRGDILWITAFRNFLAPAMMLGVLLIIDVDPLVAKTAVTMAALPVATVYSTFSVAFDTEPQQASLTIFLSTALSMFTVPAWHYLLEILFAA